MNWFRDERGKLRRWIFYNCSGCSLSTHSLILPGSVVQCNNCLDFTPLTEALLNPIDEEHTVLAHLKKQHDMLWARIPAERPFDDDEPDLTRSLAK